MLSLYRQLALIRYFETESERQYKKANIGGYCHLSSGQEATNVGIVQAMKEDDLLISGYRCHGLAIAKGVGVNEAMAELFGKESGCSGGRGGSMHLLDVSKGYYGGWGIVGGQLPLAVGMGLAIVREKKEQVVVCELGDGAVNIGAFHESLNLAALWKLPVVFVVLNNGYGMGTAVSRASSQPDLAKRATAYAMPGHQFDGQDVEQVIKDFKPVVEAARAGEPQLVEMLTYRYRGHSVADKGLSYRTKQEIAEAEKRDPLLIARRKLEQQGVTTEEINETEKSAKQEIADAVQFALDAPEPKVEELPDGMYAPGSKQQFKAMIPGSPFGEAEVVEAIK